VTQAEVGRNPLARLRNMTQTGETIIIEDAHALSDWMPASELDWIRSHLAAPIRLSGKYIGYLGVYSRESGYFTQLHADRLRVFADQAAIAIRNAQLFQQSQELAVLEERQRLARDLHDAVSQTLFSASVMAETLPRLWERNPQQVRESLDDLHRLTRGALAEMRTLLLELRPAALASTPLNDLLVQLSESVHGRSRIQVRLISTGECALPLDAKTAFYRIAQEALNNIVKHSHAHQVDMRLQCQPPEIHLQIRDDGRGFDPKRAGQARLGLGIMRERAEAIGARFVLTSQPGHGAEITVAWSNKPLLIEKE
jgi:two-component system nitrate/nitrite sensor histidine kinase NarX